MVEPINRSQFLRGDLRGENLPVRPPWSVAESMFVERCNRCGDCLTACEQRILQKGSGGFPEVNFSQGPCTFCGACVKSCAKDALAFHLDTEHPPWSLSIEINQACLSQLAVVCRVCGERCDGSAIRFRLQTGGRAIPEVDEDLCTGCGECVGACPTQAIRIRPVRQVRAA